MKKGESEKVLFTFYTDKELGEKIKNYSKEQGMSVPSFIRQALIKALKADKENNWLLPKKRKKKGF